MGLAFGFGLIGAEVAGQMAVGNEMAKTNYDTAGPDTRIEGVSKAVLIPGRKGHPEYAIAQSDVSQSYEWFKQAAATQASYYMQGLSLYGQSIEDAAKSLAVGFASGNYQLSGYSTGGREAYNEMLKMMGLDPIQSTAGYGEYLANMGADRKIANYVRSADTFKGADARAEARTTLYGMVDEQAKLFEAEAAKQADVIKQINKLGFIGGWFYDKQTIEASKNPDKAGEWNHPNMTASQAIQASLLGYSTGTALDSVTWEDFLAGNYNHSDVVATWMPEEYNRYFEGAQNKWNTFKQGKINDAQYAADVANSSAKSTRDMYDVWNAAYTDEYQTSYTSDQVAERIMSRPGFQFNLEQGNKAIQRSASAKGMLSSGNTLAAMAQYSSDLGLKYYNDYMSQLSGIAGAGQAADTQISQNLVKQGGTLASLQAGAGETALNTYSNIGNAYAQSLYTSGQLYAQNTQFNVQQQNQAIQQLWAMQSAKQSQASQQAFQAGLQGSAQMAQQNNAILSSALAAAFS